MARREVDLVIRARDQAARVVEEITKVLDAFGQSQKEVSADAKKTDSAIGNLANAFTELDKTMKGMKAADRIASEFQKAETSAERLRDGVAGLQKELTEQTQRMDRAARDTAEYERRLNGATEALRRKQQALADTTARQKALQADVDRTAAALDKMRKAIDRQSTSLSSQEQKVDRAVQKYAELSAEIAKVEKPTKAQARALETSSRAVERERAKLEELRGSLAKTAVEYTQTWAANRQFTEQLDRTVAKTAQVSRAVDSIAKNQKGLRTELQASSRAQAQFGDAVDVARAQLARQTTELEKADAGLVEIRASAIGAAAAMSQLGASGTAALTDDLARQRRAVLESKREWVQKTAAVKEYQRQIGAAGVPTLQMAAALDKSKSAAAQAKQEYLAQRQALQELSNAAKTADQSIEGLAEAQTKMAAAQARANASLATIRQSFATFNRDLDRNYQAMERSAQASARTAVALSSTARASRQTTAATSGLAGAYRELYGESRQALSLTQRWRGEVLALISAYGGIFAVIGTLGQVVNAYQTLEAAQSRLNVVFEGNTAATAEELDFLRRNAERLGVSLGVLSNEYTKFAVATQGTNLQGQATRDIFLAVSEAARVNRATNDQLAGTFVALTQIVSKGTVSMEELRQQLGDRLPGAIQIMADALGVTSAELTKMVANGEVTSDALIDFAEELDRRFGAQLPDALQSTTVELGRLQNAAFNALLEFGNAGFIESFTELVKDLTDLLQSAEFETFIQRLSRATAALVDALGFIVRNFELLGAVLGALVGIKAAAIIGTMTRSLGGLRAASAAATGAVGGVGAAAAASTAGMAAATGAVGRLTVALRTLMSATGFGLLITAVTAGFGYWLTSANDVNTAMSEHERIMDAVKNTYDETGGSIEVWRQALQDIAGITETEAKLSADAIEEALNGARNRLLTVWANDAENMVAQFFGLGFLSGASNDYNREVETVIMAFRRGEMSSQDLLAAIDDINQKFYDGSAANREYGGQLVEVIKEIIELEETLAEADAVVTAVTGSTEEAEEALDGLAGGTENLNAGFEAAAQEGIAAFQTAMDELKDQMPGLDATMSQFEQTIMGIETAFQSAVTAARALPDAIMRIAAEQEALAARNEALIANTSAWVDGGMGGSLVDRIIGVESGGNPNARNPNSTATGLGQFIESTWLRMFEQYFPDRAAGMTREAILALRNDPQLSRQMTELYIGENANYLAGQGITPTDANLYLAHFLGPGGAANLLGSAPGTPTSAVLGADQINANASILQGKTREEVIAWAERKVGIGQTELEAAERLNEIEEEQADRAATEAERAAEQAAREQESTDSRIADGEFELRQQQLINEGKERQAAIEAAARDARADNPNISAEELAQIEAQAAALYDSQQAGEAILTDLEKAEAAQERINTLLEYRAALQEQQDLALEGGDTAKAEELADKIAGVNTELQDAITNAQALWETVGGDQADAAIAQLEVMRIETDRFAESARRTFVDWERVGELFVGGLTTAFDSFAQGLAEGKTVIEAARDSFLKFASDFLIQIGQMIVRQAILNSLQGTRLGGLFGITAAVPVAHSGAVVGRSSGVSRSVSPGVFAGASRFHTGGFPGLAPDEVPVIAQRGEEILAADDPRNALNGGGTTGSATTRPLKIVNNIQGRDMAAAMLEDEDGSEVFYNWFRANRGTLTTILGS